MMSKEYPSVPKTSRSRKRRTSGRKPYEINSLYAAAAEFKKRHPQATAMQAWKHFTGLAGMDAVILAFDESADALTYAPDTERYATRQVKRRSFEQRYYRLKVSSASRSP